MSGVYRFFDLSPVRVDSVEEVLAGLTAAEPMIPPKFFYDEHGSQLFDAITGLPEYYPTRVETALLEDNSTEIGRHFRGDVTLIEYGSGSSRKIRALLEGMHPSAYVPLDISRDHLESSARTLQGDYPWLNIYAVCADYGQALELPSEIPLAQPMAFFPGSSIGNFAPPAAIEFLRRVRQMLGAQGKLLIGVDRKKDRQTLEDAYNDSAGVTARFNRNVLTHLNTAFGADFDVSAWQHEAVFNESLGCIQMFLVANADQRVHVGETAIEFAAGARIHTENSYKYHREEFVALAGEAGFVEEWHLTESRERFSVYLLAVDAEGAGAPGQQ